jgi:hypothetical protein
MAPCPGLVVSVAFAAVLLLSFLAAGTLAAVDLEVQLNKIN